MYDLIIIGAGPAGLTAGIYAQRAGLKTLLLEKESIGGQIASSPLVENYPGFSHISGAELANNFFNQVLDLGIDFEIEEVLSITDGDIKEVITDSNTYKTKSIIIATGAKHRLLNIENEEDLIGSGIHFCTSCDGAFYKDKTVAVIGGANTAITNAIYMAGIASKVYLICRKPNLKGDKLLIDSLNNYKNIEVLYNTNLIKLPKENIESVKINIDGKDKILNVDGIFLSIGMDASSSLVDNLLDKTKDNYIITDNCKTNKEGIFVAGDCREKDIRQVTTAVSDGTICANLAINYVRSKK